LILPPDLLPETGFGVRMKFLSDPRNEIEAQMVNGLLQKTVFSHVPDLLGESLQRLRRAAFWAARAWKISIAPSPTPWPTILARSRKNLRTDELRRLRIQRPGPDPDAGRQPIDPSLRRLDTDAKPGATRPAADAKPAASTASDVFSRIVKIRNRAGGRQTGRERRWPRAPSAATRSCFCSWP